MDPEEQRYPDPLAEPDPLSRFDGGFLTDDMEMVYPDRVYALVDPRGAVVMEYLDFSDAIEAGRMDPYGVELVVTDGMGNPVESQLPDVFATAIKAA